jgi:hypothetical protein
VATLKEDGAVISQADYLKYVRLIAASLYALSINGRPNAISKLSMDCIPDLLERGYVSRNRFKTQRFYKYQMVTVSDISKQLLRDYINVIRAKIIENSTVEAPVKYCFINYEGNSYTDMGRRATEFYDMLPNGEALHLTTNTLRSIVETEFERLHAEGMSYFGIVIMYLNLLSRVHRSN